MTSAAINSAVGKFRRPVARLVLMLCAACCVPILIAPSIADQPPTEPRAMVGYRDFLVRYPDSPEYDAVSRRLADLLVDYAADAELNIAIGTHDDPAQALAVAAAYDEAIRHYERLLQKQTLADSAILYQLSRAYQARGQSALALTTIDQLLAQGPDNNVQLYWDTRFRQGELFFSRGAYSDAGDSYRAVVQLGTSVPVYDQALYKLGWSLFKDDRYREALAVLFTFLDRKKNPREGAPDKTGELSVADTEQLADVRRVISRSFAELGGVEAVDLYFDNTTARSHRQAIYLDLAQWYVEQEQVGSAAGTWLALAQRDPMSEQAPGLVVRAIELTRKAGFEQRVIALEVAFVESFALDGPYWALHSPAAQPELVQRLQTSVRDLSQYYHHMALERGNAGDVAQAERWYRQYLAWFGGEEGAAGMNYQLAELLYATGHHPKALLEYEQAAWSYGVHPDAADAALGLQRTWEAIVKQAPTGQSAQAIEGEALAAIRFVTTFPEHAAAPGLLAQAGTYLLEQGRFDEVLELAQHTLEKPAPVSLRQVAWSVSAQALFATQQYAAAATAYREALAVAVVDDARLPALREGLARAIYNEAGQLRAAGDNQVAAKRFSEVAALTADPSLRSTAHYDAASALIAQAAWTQAIDSLQQFREDYPNDALHGEVTLKLAYAYEAVADRSRAGDEYLKVAQDPGQSEDRQRQALVRAGNLFDQAGLTSQAISAKEQYLARFPEPAVIAIGVMQALAELESSRNSAHRRKHWLAAIVELDRAGGSSQTLVPAAEAALELAQDRLRAFNQIALVNPVQKNLALKITAMKRALTALQRSIDYHVPEVTTAATHHMASMYAQLGEALLSSERPASLSPVERVEYDVLLAEQAAPFEQNAIDIYRRNTARASASADEMDPWIEKSMRQLEQMQAGR